MNLEHITENTSSVDSVLNNDLAAIRQAFAHAHDTMSNPHEYEAEAREVVEKIYNAFDHRGIDLIPLKHIWNEVGNHGFLVRRDDPVKVLDAILDNKEIALTPPNDGYANASVDSDEGLKIALSEGLLGAEVNMVYGFEYDGLAVKKVKKNDQDLRQQSRFTYVRSVSGTVTPDHIKYMIMRVPAKLFPPEKLTDEEHELFLENTPPPYIIRATKLSLSPGNNKQKLH